MKSHIVIIILLNDTYYYNCNIISLSVVPRPVAHSVASMTKYPGILSLILAQFHTFVDVDHISSTLILLLSLIQEGLLSVTGEWLS